MVILMGAVGGGSIPLFVAITFIMKAIDKKLMNKRIRLLEAFEK